MNIEEFKDAYLKNHHLFNPSRKDASTKQALWDAAWKQFITEELWLKLDLCHFENVNQDRYIITGGPGVGKTTIIKYLEQLGESVVHEAATDIIKQEQEKGISEPWTKEGFREKIISLQEERQRLAKALKVQRVFFDRSPIDTDTFRLRFNGLLTKELKNAVEKLLHDEYYAKTVFLIESLGVCKKDEVRCEDLDESLLMQEKLRERYIELGFKVISIPSGTVEERVAIILRK